MSNNVKVLYITYDGLTDPLGQSQILPYLVGLSKRGYQYSVISCEKTNHYYNHKKRVQEICDKHSINWHPLMYTKKPPVLSTLYDIFRMRQLAFRLHQSLSFDIVHCRSYISALIGKELKHKKGVKFIFDMRGFWPDERVDGGLWKLNNLLYKTIYQYFKKQEILFLNEADYIISLTYNAADEINKRKELKKQPIPIEVIPCSADMEFFNPAKVSDNEKLKLKQSLGISDIDFVLSYIGSLGTWYLLDDMLDFFAVLKDNKPASKFLFITNDPAKDEILEKARQKGLSNEDIIITQATRDKMPIYISLSDYTIFFIKPTYSKKASSPVKQGEAMSMGIPIICNSGIGDTDIIVKESKAGFVVNDLNRKSYLDVVKHLDMRMDKSSIQAGAVRWYSLQSAIDKYESVYKKVLSR